MTPADRARVEVAGMVFCDYCPAVATRFIQRGPVEHRSFACETHYHRALRSFDCSHFTDPPLYDQPEKRLRVDDAERVWRASAKKAREHVKKLVCETIVFCEMFGRGSPTRAELGSILALIPTRELDEAIESLRTSGWLAASSALGGGIPPEVT